MDSNSMSSGGSNASVDNSIQSLGSRCSSNVVNATAAGDPLPNAVDVGMPNHLNMHTGGVIGYGNGGAKDNSGLSAEIKEIYRALYIVTKKLDEAKKSVASISELFHNDIEEKRAQLVQLCKQLIFKDHESVGKRAREIMWRKGYYEFIAYVKKNLYKEIKAATATTATAAELVATNKAESLQKLERFLCAGISNYKRLAAQLEELYDLDLKYLIDLSIINEGGRAVDFDSNAGGGGIVTDKSVEAVSFALDTIHSSLLSLGDLHRYFLDFHIETKLKVTQQQAAKYYFEAFKLNPAIGMAQNQLGTLYYGQNHDLDSIYYYLYSLVSIVPFELSENNVCKLFATHTAYLEQLEPDKIEFSLNDFYSRFYLIVDIFFFDKEVPEFNSLCHCVLVDLRKVLYSEAFKLDGPSIFKIVSILFFCLSKLKMINSAKVFSLHAFLVAVCSDLIDACIVNVEQTILAKAQENESFQLMYAARFDEFDTLVRKSRNEHKQWLTANQQAMSNEPKNEKKLLGKISQKNCSSEDSRESQRSHEQLPQDNYHHQQHQLHQESNGGGGFIEPVSTRSSDEAKESDLKTPLSCKSKKRGMRLRRRRRKIAQSDDSSCYDTESELDTDFSTDDEDYTDLSSNFDTDFSDVEHLEEKEQHAGELNKQQSKAKPLTSNVAMAHHHNSKESVNSDYNGQVIGGGRCFSDNEDVVIEEEEIIYPNGDKPVSNSQEIDSEELLHSFEILHLNGSGKALSFNQAKFNQKEEQPKQNSQVEKKFEVNANAEPPMKLVYSNKYTKINPNIIIEFAQHEPTFSALKILFDWLRSNHEILFGCYHSNPEFIHKIMKLLNYCNIDIFTRKVYFEREFLTTSNVRQGLSELFDVRSTVPLHEDMVFKSFDIFQGAQLTLDWEVPASNKVTPQEECILRIFKMVDFGFFICKQKKFNYRFCVKSRRFTENIKKKRGEAEKKTSSRRRERRKAKDATRKRHAEGRTRRYSDRKNGIVRKSYTSNEEKDTVEEGRKMPRKGYLRIRNSEKEKEKAGGSFTVHNNAGSGGSGGNNAGSGGCGGGDAAGSGGGAGGGNGSTTTTTTNTNGGGAFGEKNMLQSSSGADEERSETISKKCEIMGKLWLKNEVETLEEELRKNPVNIVMTPFLVVDAKALTEYNGIVKNLVKSKKFIVLIPNAVFNELDDLKKRSENARNVIRWLEQEFKHGNRHMRAQRDNENLTLPLLKIPRKLDRDASAFLQIAQFCNHLVANHADPNSSEFQANVVTYLSGDSLHEKQRNQNNFSFTGILDSIPVRHDQIANFYAKFKANKK